MGRTSLVQTCVETVANAVLQELYGDSHNASSAEVGANDHSPRSEWAEDSGERVMQPEAVTDVTRFLSYLAYLPVDIRLDFLRLFQQQWRDRVNELKRNHPDNWWQSLLSPSQAEIEVLVWKELIQDDVDILVLADNPPWLLSTLIESGNEYISTDSCNWTGRTLDFTGVEWYPNHLKLSEALHHLRLSCVHSLSFHGLSVVSDKHLAEIVEFIPHLQALDVSYCSNITDEGMIAILAGAYGTLRLLCCKGLRRLTWFSIQWLEKCEQLHTIDLSDCIGVDRLPELVKYRHLVTLNLQGLSGVSDKNLAATLALSWEQLERLGLGETEISSASLTFLLNDSNGLNFRHLDLSWCFNLTSSVFGLLFHKTPRLVVLNLQNTNIDDRGLALLVQSEFFSSLRELNLERCPLLTVNAFEEAFGSGNYTTVLEKINLSWDLIPTKSLSKLMRFCRKTLREIRLQGCPHLDALLLEVFTRPDKEPFPVLERLDCTWVDSISDYQFLEFIYILPNTTFVGYYGLQIYLLMTVRG